MFGIFACRLVTISWKGKGGVLQGQNPTYWVSLRFFQRMHSKALLNKWWGQPTQGLSCISEMI